jgi:hypothetical protein
MYSDPSAPLESATVNPVGTPLLSRPAKLMEVAFALIAAALAFAVAEGDVEAVAFGAASVEALSVEALSVEPEVSVEETVPPVTTVGTSLFVGIELKPRKAKKTRIKERAALLDFLATSAAFL